MSTHPDPETEHYKRVLRGLVDMANDMAQLIHQQTRRQTEAANAAIPPPTNNPFQDPAASFDRLARTIRRTILLAHKLGEMKPSHTPPQPNNHRIAVRKRILREVEDVIQLNAKPDDRPSLQAELLDRLDAPDLQDDIDTRPIDDIIDDVCRDLRVAVPYACNWKRRTPQEVETLCRQAATLPATWTTPPPSAAPDLNRRRPRKPTLPPRHDTLATVLAEYASVRRDTG